MLGSLFVENIWGVANPKVGLINIGEEEGKGNLLAQAAYPLLKDATDKSLIFISKVRLLSDHTWEVLN